MRRNRLICRLLRPFGLQRCHFKHVGIEGERGIYRCHCGCEFLGLKTPIVILPGETIAIRIQAEISSE